MSDPSSPPELPAWIQDHVNRYLASDGRDGHMWDSSIAGGPGPIPTLLLTTTGRKSGRPLQLPLIYGKTRNGYVIIASKGGAPAHPAWYLNLTAQPKVKLQVEAKRFDATARIATGSERAALWEQMAKLFPPYTQYQKRTTREIPVVVLDPVNA